MKLKALIIESNEHYRSLLETMLSDIGLTCDVFASGIEALESDTKIEYVFIVVSRYLDDINGELFLHRYREKHLLGNALTIMITTDEVSKIMMEANKAGFKLVFNEKDIDSMQAFLTRVVNNRTLNLKGKILYIEDQKNIAAAMIALFENYQGNVDHVTSMGEAKEKFNKNNYDLVITDDYLENGEAGDDIIHFVRSFNDSNKSHIPILVVSGESDPAKRTAFLRNGANDFIIKPYDEDELIVRSSNLIESKKVHEQAKQQQQELTKLAMTDQLTGLYNRHSLFDIGPKYLSDAKRHKFSVSLLVIDLDHFKKVNDTHGHGVGDIVLKEIGKILNQNCRNEDFVARFGGEEFVMIFSHCDINCAETKAENIRMCIEKSRPNGLTITASIGLALYYHNDNCESLFEKADKALYEAKESGRNKIVVHRS